MCTKDKQENQNDDISKLYEEVGRKLARVRQTCGLSHAALAARLGVSVCFTEILENGILLQDGNCVSRWNACPFTRDELLRISRQLGDGSGFHPGIRTMDAETVFFCPVTINSKSVFDELQNLAACRNMLTHLARDAEGWFNVKFRLNHLQLCIKYGRKNADLVKRRLLSVLAKYETRA